MSTSGEYVTELSGVREVSLLGTADLAFWTDHLSAEGLAPAEREGRAELLVVAAAMRYGGIRFTEVSFSVPVRPPAGGGGDAAFLVRAFTSCRLFALCERVLFSAPYAHARCRVSSAPPATLEVATGDRAVLRAGMGGPLAGRAAARAGDAAWEGPVLLPAGRGRGSQFLARLRGYTEAYPFHPGDDAVSIAPPPGPSVFRALVDSGFVGREWVLRQDATHARSKTYPRAGPLARHRG